MSKHQDQKQRRQWQRRSWSSITRKELRALLNQYLSQEGFDIVQAEDGQQALFAVRHEKPDLIVLDLMMPEMGGYQSMPRLRREGDGRFYS